MFNVFTCTPGHWKIRRLGFEIPFDESKLAFFNVNWEIFENHWHIRVSQKLLLN